MFLRTIKEEPLPRATAAVVLTMLGLTVAGRVAWHFWPDHTTVPVCGGFEQGSNVLQEAVFGEAGASGVRVLLQFLALMGACGGAFFAAVQEVRRMLLYCFAGLTALFLLFGNVGLLHGGCLLRMS